MQTEKSNFLHRKVQAFSLAYNGAHWMVGAWCYGGTMLWGYRAVGVPVLLVEKLQVNRKEDLLVSLPVLVWGELIYCQALHFFLKKRGGLGVQCWDPA